MRLYMIDREQAADSFTRYVHGLDTTVKALSNVVSDQSKKWQTLYKREYQRIGYSFTNFGQYYGMEEQTGEKSLFYFWPNLFVNII